MSLGNISGAIEEATKQLKALRGASHEDFQGLADVAQATDAKNRQLDPIAKGVGGIDYSELADPDPFGGVGLTAGASGDPFSVGAGGMPRRDAFAGLRYGQPEAFGALHGRGSDPFRGTTPGGRDDPFGFYTDIYANAQRSRDTIAWKKAQAAKQVATGDSSSWGGTGDASKASGLEGTKQWQSLMEQAASESGVPWQVLAAIMAIESGGQNLGANAAGATGLMQVVPRYWQTTANQYGGDLSNPWTNIRTAADILKGGYDRYGSWANAAAYYFGGPGAFADGGYSNNADYFGTDIQTYVDRFNNNMAGLGYGQGANVASGNPRTDSAVAAAQSVLGSPYVWGGESLALEGGFDCSGLVQWAFAQAGIALPRLASQQIGATQRISMDQARAGDLLFFQFPPEMVRAEKNTVNHVAIYLGNGQMLQASTNGGDVHIREVDDWYMQYFAGAGRVPMGKDYGPDHTGVDAPGRRGARVNAVRRGSLIGIGDDPELGHHATVFDGQRFYTYGHLEPGTLERVVGDEVGKGQTLARIGMTGKSSGPHVHLDVVDLDGNTLDPFDYM